MCNVQFQQRLITAPGDPRNFCRPDVVFTYDGKGAIVDTKNYMNTPLSTRDVDKLYNDMLALKQTNWTVTGYIYTRMGTLVSTKVYQYATERCIIIAREGVIDPDKLAVIIDRTLREGTCSLSRYQSRLCLHLQFPFLIFAHVQQYQCTLSLLPVSLILISLVLCHLGELLFPL